MSFTEGAIRKVGRVRLSRHAFSPGGMTYNSPAWSGASAPAGTLRNVGSTSKFEQASQRRRSAMRHEGVASSGLVPFRPQTPDSAPVQKRDRRSIWGYFPPSLWDFKSGCAPLLTAATWRCHEQSGHPLPAIEAATAATSGSGSPACGTGGRTAPRSLQFATAHSLLLPK